MAALPIYGKTTLCFQEETSSVAKMASWYNTDDVTGLFQRPRSGASRPSSAASPRTQSPLPHPPAINPTLLSTQPIPSSALVYAAAAAGKDIFSSPEPSGSQGELIVYPYSGVRCRHRQQCLNISSETALPIKAKFYVEPPWEGGTKVYIKGPGHMTKMAAMPIYGKNH